MHQYVRNQVCGLAVARDESNPGVWAGREVTAAIGLSINKLMIILCLAINVENTEKQMRLYEESLSTLDQMESS